MAEMEKDHDPRDLLAVLIPEQHIFTGTVRLHHHICSRLGSLSDDSISVDILPNSGLWHRYTGHRPHVSQVWS